MENVNKNQQFFINELIEQREELINTYGEDKGIKNWVDQDYYDGEYYITPSYRWYQPKVCHLSNCLRSAGILLKCAHAVL